MTFTLSLLKKSLVWLVLL